MKVEIDKDNLKIGNEFTLSIQSGHFKGTLESIDKESMVELYEKLGHLLNADSAEAHKVLVWNPRSQRHEYKTEN